MRVIGGKFRSRKLVGFEGESIRPTADRTRESLFNILRIGEGVRFLDAFCGSGAVGIEAISRGATSTFLDCDGKSAAIAERNFALLGIDAKVRRTRAEDFLSATAEKYDVIFLDPPYASESGRRALEIIGERRILAENGVSERSIYRYVEELIVAGVPIDIIRGRNGGICLPDTYRLPENFFTKDEYTAAINALGALYEQLHDDTIKSALDKLRQKSKEDSRNLTISGNILVDSGSWGDVYDFSEK